MEPEKLGAFTAATTKSDKKQSGLLTLGHRAIIMMSEKDLMKNYEEFEKPEKVCFLIRRWPHC